MGAEGRLDSDSTGRCAIASEHSGRLIEETTWPHEQGDLLLGWRSRDWSGSQANRQSPSYNKHRCSRVGRMRMDTGRSNASLRNGQ